VETVTRNAEFSRETYRAGWLRLGSLFGGKRLLFLAGRLLYSLTIEGEARVPVEGACLFPFNHVSQPADLLANALIRRRRPDVYIFGWQGLQGENPLAQFLSGVGERDPEQRLLRAYKAQGLSAGELLRALRVLQQDGAIAIAAEGEITWDGRLQHPLAPGTAWLALRTGAQIVPVVSSGGYDVQPRWQMDKIRLAGRIAIRAGQPFTLCETPLARAGNQALQAANERLWQAMAALQVNPAGRRHSRGSPLTAP
jgi:1-acyl-sn-glycerol-3-phosphate acyltransferase